MVASCDYAASIPARCHGLSADACQAGAVTTGRAPMGFGGRLLANGSALFVVIQAAASLAAG